MGREGFGFFVCFAFPLATNNTKKIVCILHNNRIIIMVLTTGDKTKKEKYCSYPFSNC